MSRTPQRAGWAIVPTGILWSAAASADCSGIEMATFEQLPDGQRLLVESSCHTGSELFLPWVDPGIHVAVPERAARSSVSDFGVQELEALDAIDVSEQFRVVPEVDLPE